MQTGFSKEVIKIMRSNLKASLKSGERVYGRKAKHEKSKNSNCLVWKDLRITDHMLFIRLLKTLYQL